MGVSAADNQTRTPVTIENKVIEEGTLLASAARTATVSSSDMTNPGFTGVMVIVTSTAFALTPSITCTIQGKNPVTGAYYTILASAAITDGSTTRILTVLPGATASANVTINMGIPKIWRVTMTHSDTDSITYSVAYSYLG